MKKTLKFLLIGLIIGLLAIYIIGAIAFSFYTYPNTRLDGEFLGAKKISELSFTKIIDDEYTIQLVNKEAQVPVKVEKYIDKDSKLSRPFLWILDIIQGYNISMERRLVKDSLSEKIKELNSIKEKSAYVDVKNDKALIIDEIYSYDIPEDFEIIEKDKTINFAQYKVKPEILSTDLEDRKKDIQALLDSSLTLIGFSLKGEEYLNLYNEDLTMNTDKVKEFVDMVAEETNTINKHRPFTTAYGSHITVEPGVYGWMLDREETVNQILETKKGEVQPKYVSYAKVRDNTYDIGSTYLELDIDDQRLYGFINDQKILDEAVVTGHQGISDTPSGVFVIWAKEKDQALKGVSALTGEEYSTPVKYWIPINWTGIGLHDATWRSSFGGQIYKTDGSNGCINLPLKVAEQVFNNFDIGTPVIIY